MIPETTNPVIELDHDDAIVADIDEGALGSRAIGVAEFQTLDAVDLMAR